MKIVNSIKLAGLAMITVFLLSSCGAKQANQLLKHQTELEAIANNKSASPEQKMDVLMANMVTMMHEGMRIANPKKGVKYVSQFGKENGKVTNLIFNEFSDWQKNMSTSEKLAMGGRMLTKPYMKDALTLIPKFVRKYKQIAFVSKTVGGLKQKLMGGNLLGDGLKSLGL